MASRRLLMVSVIGAAQCTQQEARVAEKVGRLLATRGVVLVCGGRGGVMEAACRGAQEAGGLTIGILPGTDPAAGNPYLSFAFPTGLGEARNVLVARAGQAVIAIGGALGTLSEIAFALKAGRRVIGLNTWRAQDAEGRALPILYAQGAEEAVELAMGGGHRLGDTWEETHKSE